MKKLVFLHSPIQIAILDGLIKSGQVSSDETFIFHRNQKPPVSFRVPHVFSSNYALNDVPFITALFSCPKEPIEVILPHSLCYAFHLAEALDHVQRISYIEEGTGTIYAIRNNDFRLRLRMHTRSFLDRIKLVIKLTISLQALDPRLITTALAADNKFRSNVYDRFIDYQSPKMGHVYSISPWHSEDDIYKPVPMLGVGITGNENGILIAIGKSDIVINGYWELIDKIARSIEALGLSYRVKLHPSIKKNSFKGKNRLRDRFLSNVEVYDPGSDELGFAIIKDGFLGAVSFFSSYQVYAHTLSQALGKEFPMLCLERILGKDDYAVEVALLPECNLMDNVFFDVDAWLEKIAKHAAIRYQSHP